jgi:hypothetical protein
MAEFIIANPGRALPLRCLQRQLTYPARQIILTEMVRPNATVERVARLVVSRNWC